MQTDIIFLGTFHTDKRNIRLSSDKDDKTYTLNELIKGPFMLLFIFSSMAFIVFLFENDHVINTLAIKIHTGMKKVLLELKSKLE